MLEALLREPGVMEKQTLRSPFGFMAIHGGSLERGTAEIAAAAADAAGASFYAVVQPEGLRWHIPSTRFAAAASPRLASFLEHVAVVISVHGYGRPDLPNCLLLGGTDRDLASQLAARLRVALPNYELVDALDQIPEGMRGVHPSNPVNCARGPGVQLELCPRVRDSAEHRIALIEALANFATTYLDQHPAR